MYALYKEKFCNTNNCSRLLLVTRVHDKRAAEKSVALQAFDNYSCYVDHVITPVEFYRNNRAPDLRLG